MSVITKTAIVAAGALAAATYLASPAEADPNGGPCGLAFVPICSLIPALPNLDHDVDLTTDPNGLTGGGGADQTSPIGVDGG